MSLSRLRFLGVALLLGACLLLAAPATSNASWLGGSAVHASSAARHEGFFARLLRFLVTGGVSMDPNGGTASTDPASGH
jgi:hypothetical protein